MEKINLIKDLRERTGAGFVDCKNALYESKNNIEEAINILRQKGISRAVKKSKRTANEGIVSININDENATIIEINTETDFVAKNSEFLDFVKEINSLSNKADDVQSLLNVKHNEKNTINDSLTNLISKIGENILINRFQKINVEKNTKVYGYVHNRYEDNIGKIASLMKIKSESFDEELDNLSKNICMHIAASKPISISINELDEKIVDNEISIIKESIKSSGKPKNIIDNIVNGKLNKFYEEVVLLEQKYIVDNETKIKDLLKQYKKTKNIDINITDFKLFVLGS